MSSPETRKTADPQLLAAVLDQMQDALIVADRSGAIQLWNRGAEIIFGFDASEAIGRNLDLIVPARFQQQHEAGYKRTIASGQLRTHGRLLTTRANHKYGSRLYVEFSFGLVKDSAGQVSGLFAVGRDVTARHQAEVAARVMAAP
jgi:PAS domain S-box-containing protein